MKIAYKGKSVITKPTEPVLPDAFVVVDGNRIDSIGKNCPKVCQC